MSFELTQKIKVVNPHANIDELYGPYESINDFFQKVPTELRMLGRTIGIVDGGSIVEYWFKDGITDDNLIIKKSSTEDQNYVHDQVLPSKVWVINHPLNKKVSVTVIDTAGTQVEGRIKINSGSTVTIEFNFPFNGEAILN